MVPVPTIRLKVEARVFVLLILKPICCCRLRGEIEMYGAGKSMVELLLATLSGQIEW